MIDEETTKYYDLVERIEELCRKRGELSFAQIEKMALEKEIRPTAILEELSINPEFKVDLSGGKVVSL